MKLVIMIPAYNEEESLPIAFNALPKKIDGIDTIQTLLINDGSVDRTLEVAKELGIDEIINFKQNQGLAAVFKAGLLRSAALGADVTVTFDADNQYDAANIPDLIKPIIDGMSDIVVGCRPIKKISHFSFVKKRLQNLGSRVVSSLAKIDIPDVTSGYRAYSREASLRLVLVSNFTYTLETIIQAKSKGLKVTHVPIGVNEGKLRESRLFKSSAQYIRKSLNTMFRVYFMYQPFRVLSKASYVFLIIGLTLSFRFLYFLSIANGQAVGHVQSLILAAIMYIIAVFLFTTGLVVDLIYNNRKYIEEVLYYQRKKEIC